MSDVTLNTASGAITLTAANSSGNKTLTLPAVSGTVLTSVSPQSSFPSNIAWNGPAFRAYMATAQTITAATITKLNFNTELFDTNNNYDVTTNRFTPTVAGYYQISANIYTTSTSQIMLYKNGIYDVSGIYLTGVGQGVYGLMYLNGTTDYLEAYYYGNATITTSNNAAGNTLFSAFLARSA